MNHPDFPEEAGMYLEANGYKRADSDSSRIAFFKDDMACVATGSKIEFLSSIDEEEGQRSDSFRTIAKYEGIQNLKGIFEWMLLFHITGFVLLKDFIKLAKEEGRTSGEEIINLFGHNAIAANF